jgi:polar amino acid transport system substrate-binding protein
VAAHRRNVGVAPSPWDLRRSPTSDHALSFRLMASRTPVALGAAGTLLALLAGCASDTTGRPTAVNATPSAATCVKDVLPTRTAGRLTVSTGDPATAPWFSANKPQNGEGFESAVAYAVAGRLGYAADDVTWIRVDDHDATSAGPKPFDVGIDLFAHSPERKKLVDMSSWYYLDRQAVVTLKDSVFAHATTIAALQQARLGVRTGTTGVLAATELIRPATAPQTFDSLDDAARALNAEQIDALVTDLPAAFAMTAGGPQGPVIAGQLPRVGVPDQFGLVLEKDSPLTGCVRKAVDGLREDGTLLMLEKQWLTRATGVPELF